jgi:hypothetical protein
LEGVPAIADASDYLTNLSFRFQTQRALGRIKIELEHFDPFKIRSAADRGGGNRSTALVKL